MCLWATFVIFMLTLAWKQLRRQNKPTIWPRNAAAEWKGRVKDFATPGTWWQASCKVQAVTFYRKCRHLTDQGSQLACLKKTAIILRKDGGGMMGLNSSERQPWHEPPNWKASRRSHVAFHLDRKLSVSWHEVLNSEDINELIKGQFIVSYC